MVGKVVRHEVLDKPAERLITKPRVMADQFQIAIVHRAQEGVQVSVASR